MSDGVEAAAAADDAPPLMLREGLPAVIESADDLGLAVERVTTGHGPVAVDAERASGYRYSQRAYLIQLRRAGSGTLLIDPAAFGPVPNQSMLSVAQAAGDAEWVIHAASQDLTCLAEVGITPRRIFDTELAGRLLNLPRVGLAVLVEQLMGYSMRKEHSAVDWSRRPLKESWLVYAALDVELLLELRDVLEQRLREADKWEWAEQEFAALVGAFPMPPRAEPWRRTSGIHRVRGRRGLAVVRAVWEERDRIARDRDISSSRILRDDAIVGLALAGRISRSAMLELPAFSHGRGRRFVREFHAAATTALDLPEAALPTVGALHDGPPPARSWASRFPVEAARLARCRAAVVELAATLDVPQENLLAPDVVRQLAWRPPTPPDTDSVAAALAASGARPWQVAHTAERLTRELADLPSGSY